MSGPVLASAHDESAQLAELFALRDIAGEAIAIDLGDEAGLAAEVAELTRIVERTVAHLEKLQQIDDPDPLVEWEELSSTTGSGDAWYGTARQNPSVADVSFAGGIELRRVLRELATAPDDESRLVAAESARRKVRRAIRATLEAARESGVDVLGGEHQGHHQVADLASGLSVRRLYARYRRSLRRPTAETAEAVLEAVRYAGGALAALVTSPDYADVRALDRAVLRRLRERALEWARHDRGVASGLQLVEDLWTCCDLLRGINRRQELQQHDRELAARCAREPTTDLRAWFSALDPLFGLDDQLDELIDRARTAVTAVTGVTTEPEALDSLVAATLACLARVSS